MSEYPTSAEVIKECANITQYVNDEVTFTEYIIRAGTDVKRYLLNLRSIEWRQVYVESLSEYYTNQNEDNLKKAIRLMAIAIIYKDNARATDGDPYWQLSGEYFRESAKLIDQAKLDLYLYPVDVDDINALTRESNGQSFLRK